MIELVLVYCLSSSPDRCLERREEMEASVSLLGCSLRAQASAREYVEAHPSYRLARFRCEKDHPRESPA